MDDFERLNAIVEWMREHRVPRLRIGDTEIVCVLESEVRSTREIHATETDPAELARRRAEREHQRRERSAARMLGHVVRDGTLVDGRTR